MRLSRLVSILSFLLLVAGSHAQPVSFPLSRSADGRSLKDSSGTPFPILGRTAWFITSLSQSDYRLFIDDTAAKGFNTIEFHVINHDPRGNNPPFGGNGTLPFLQQLSGGAWNGTGTPDLTTPNENYWIHVDGILTYAQSKNILVLMFPAYVGYAGGEQGWMQELVANGPARVQTYGAWIADRYATLGNIVWMMGGDMGTGGNPFNAAQTAVEQALLTGLQSIPNQQSTFVSAEWSSESISTDQVTFGPAMSLNGAYSWSGDCVSQGRRAYAYTPVMPAFLLEEPYDEEGPDGNSVNPSATQPVRRFQWWGWLSTTGGYLSGNGYIWPFNAGWPSHLNTQGAQDMARLNAFIRSIAWHRLIPGGLAGTGYLVIAGNVGEWLPEHVAAAATSDGRLVVAYIPPAHTGTITIDMTRLSGPSRARWFNPTTAAYSLIGASLPNTGTRIFTPPGNNGSGFSDWVLVIDVCYANCDGSTTLPILNVNDFICFTNRYAAAEPYANCDGSTLPPVLNVNDFTCFLNSFAAECP